MYECSKHYNEKQFGFAEFCFRCSKWITSKTDWEAHCQAHIDNFDLPSRCDPVKFRNATACAGYCIGCWAKKWLPAAERLQQYPERPKWQEHISRCIPEFIASLPNNDSIPCPHLLCPVMLHSESDLWYHIGDIHSTHKPNVAKKRQPRWEESEIERAETQRAAERKRPRLQGKLDDGDSKALYGRNPSRFKDPFGYKFVNMSTIDFDPSAADVIKMEEVASGSSSSSNTSDDGVWDKHDDGHSTDTSLSSLSDDILEAFTQTEEGCDSPWMAPLEVTNDLFGNTESWKFNANPDVVSPSIDPLPEDWILYSPGTHLSYLSNDPTDFVDPQLQDAIPFSTPDLPAATDSVEDAHRNIPTTGLGHVGSTVTHPLCDSQRVGGPVAIDAERGIWEAEELLAKWKRGKTTWYLVKWKGFLHENNTWQRPKDIIDRKLIQDFEINYQGNHSGVRLLKKRVQKGKVEYRVEWKGRPESENSWEKEATISRERIMEFEAS